MKKCETTLQEYERNVQLFYFNIRLNARVLSTIVDKTRNEKSKVRFYGGFSRVPKKNKKNC